MKETVQNLKKRAERLVGYGGYREYYNTYFAPGTEYQVVILLGYTCYACRANYEYRGVAATRLAAWKAAVEAAEEGQKGHG